MLLLPPNEKPSQLFNGHMHLTSEKSSVIVKPTMIDKFKRLITLRVQHRRTMGWILAVLEESERGVKQKYIRKLVKTAWLHRGKVTKFFAYFDEFLSSNNNIVSTIIALKSLILLHDYIKKGPAEAIIDQTTSAQTLLSRITSVWTNVDDTDDSRDKKRSAFSRKLILGYARWIQNKLSIANAYAKLIEGNYSLAPFFENPKGTDKQPPLSPKLIDDLLKL